MKTFEELGASPTPWVARKSPIRSIEDCNGKVVADAWHTNKDNEAANAYLIAASPHLYEALRVLLETLDGYGFQPILADDPLAVAVKCGQIALAKAEGSHE